jgi:hypothetical protein
VRGVLLLGLLLLPLAAVAEEKPAPPPDPVKALPKCLQPGVKATYDRAASEAKLAGTVTFRTEAHETPGHVRLVLEYDSGDRGLMSYRERLTAVLDAKAKKVLFTYAVGAKRDEPYVTASRVVRETVKDKPPRLVHERLTYRKKDEEPRVRRTRVKVSGAWTPFLLEPFLAPLHAAGKTESFTLKLMTELTGTIGRTTAAYRALGEGSMRIGEKDVGCRIFSRVRGADRGTVYLRKSDSLPVKAAFAGLTLRPGKKKDK